MTIQPEAFIVTLGMIGFLALFMLAVMEESETFLGALFTALLCMVLVLCMVFTLALIVGFGFHLGWIRGMQ